MMPAAERAKQVDADLRNIVADLVNDDWIFTRRELPLCETPLTTTTSRMFPYITAGVASHSSKKPTNFASAIHTAPAVSIATDLASHEIHSPHS
ncbi:hypothetical protein BSLG_001334 [Batrachochytrium salamandrivorans]|nr:hypothetical protein BSLG_001334 [Batrachochytrium salamandrivorans]